MSTQLPKVEVGQQWLEAKDENPRRITLTEVSMPDPAGELGFVETDVSLGVPEFRHGEWHAPTNHWITVRHLRTHYKLETPCAS